MIRRYKLRSGKIRYRARLYFHGVEVATRVFDRRGDAVAWEQEQAQRLRQDDWIDPRRGKVPLHEVADAWLKSRAGMKQRTRDSDEGDWTRYIERRFGKRSVVSITEAEVREWHGDLTSKRGLAPSTANRALTTFRGILGHAVADRRIRRNVAEPIKPTKRGRKREPRFLTLNELHQLADATGDAGRDVVLVLGLTGLRWSELIALQVGDLVQVPGIGVRVQRATTGEKGGGKLETDEVKNYQARTIPLVEVLRPIVDRLSKGKARTELLFISPKGLPLRESNWKRAARWSKAIKKLGIAPFRVHDLRHTAASAWIAKGADVKVVQRILGHESATMTLDLYGHLWDTSLWDAADRFTGTSPASEAESQEPENDNEAGESR
jgi:integrase